MKRLIGLALPLTLAGCSHVHFGFDHAFGGDGVKGNGKAEEVSRTLGEFDRVEVGSAFQVEASEGSQTSVKVFADSNLLPLIKTEVKNRTLKVWIDGSISSNSPLKLTLSAPKINSMVTSGATQVNLKLSSIHDLNLDGSGASKVKVSGAVSSLTCELSGASHVEVPQSTLSKLEANLSGASSLKVSGTVDLLTADLSGASSIQGGMSGREANVKLSGASNGTFGAFTKVAKEVSGSSNASFGN